MTITKWLVENIKELQIAQVDSPRLDCLILLEDILQKDRAWIISHTEHTLQKHQLEALEKLIKRRLKREPLAYIRGEVWFYGRIFKVSPSVLIPRPESEDFIGILKRLAETNTSSRPIVLDIGTGSGCLAITAKLELPNSTLIAIDNSKKALEQARQNSLNYKSNVEFITSDLLTSVENKLFAQYHSKKFIILMVNLPYVPDNLIRSKELLFEPREALFSGKDGLDHYKAFWRQISHLMSKPQHIMTESLRAQHDEMRKLAKSAGYELAQTVRLVQLFSKKSN